MFNILIIEDELSLLNILEAYFKKEEFNVFKASNGLDGLNIFKSNNIDIVCCDIMMPIIDGWQVAKSIRQLSDVPIVLMTALNSEQDQIKGYELDIDDYVTKPFSPTILIAKVRRLVKRYKNQESHETTQDINFGDLVINYSKREVLISNEEIHLSKTEFDLLKFLINNKDIAVDRVTILDEVWGMDVYVEERVVDTNIKVLRKKLGKYSSCIKTVFGIGYRFTHEEN